MHAGESENAMAEKVKARDSMPPTTATLEEIGEFWDTHSLADYWDETHEVAFEVVNLTSKTNLVTVEPEVAEQLTALATKQGISIEKLVNRWLQEKLEAVTTNQ